MEDSARCCAVLVCAGLLGALAGCERGAILDFAGAGGGGGANSQGDTVLTFFGGPSPLQAVEWASDPLDPDRRVRGTLLLASASWGGEDVYLRLYRSHIEDEDAGVRAVAIRALSLHGTPDDVPVIVEQLENGNDVVREEASRALQRLHDERAIVALLRHSDIRDEDNWKVRQYSAVALGQYAERRVIDRLIDAMNDRELSVNRAAHRSLKILTGQDFGFDARAWLTWTNKAPDIFAGRSVYEYPVFFRDPNIFEQVVPWMRVPNELAASPVGMEHVVNIGDAGTGSQ